MESRLWLPETQDAFRQGLLAGVVGSQENSLWDGKQRLCPSNCTCLSVADDGAPLPSF